jgi:hypothetical protein
MTSAAIARSWGKFLRHAEWISRHLDATELIEESAR